MSKEEKKKAQFKPSLAQAINKAIEVKEVQTESKMSWDDISKIDKDMGLTLARMVAQVKLIMKRPAIINKINEDESVAKNVTLFSKGVKSITGELREIRINANGRTGVVSDEDIYDVSQIYLKYMNIGDKIESVKSTITAVFAAVLDDDFTDRLEEEKSLKDVAIDNATEIKEQSKEDKADD